MDALERRAMHGLLECGGAKVGHHPVIPVRGAERPGRQWRRGGCKRKFEFCVREKQNILKMWLSVSTSTSRQHARRAKTKKKYVKHKLSASHYPHDTRKVQHADGVYISHARLHGRSHRAPQYSISAKSKQITTSYTANILTISKPITAKRPNQTHNQQHNKINPTINPTTNQTTNLKATKQSQKKKKNNNNNNNNH
jgi:hypothetical protein